MDIRSTAFRGECNQIKTIVTNYIVLCARSIWQNYRLVSQTDTQTHTRPPLQAVPSTHLPQRSITIPIQSMENSHGFIFKLYALKQKHQIHAIWDMLKEMNNVSYHLITAGQIKIQPTGIVSKEFTKNVGDVIKICGKHNQCSQNIFKTSRNKVNISTSSAQVN